MKRLDVNVEKERQCQITKQLVHSFSINISIYQQENSDVRWTSLSNVD